MSAGIVGCVGDDDFGKVNINRLAAAGVDTSAILTSKDRATGCAFVTYRENGGRSFIYHIPNSAAGQVDIDQVDPKWLDDCRYLHVMGSSLSIPGVYEAVVKCAGIVKANGGKISFDPNIRVELLNRDAVMRRQIMEVYRQTDLLLPGSDELALFTGTGQVEESLDHIFATTGIEEVVIKMAAKGCRYASRRERFDVAPFAVDEVDPTGAGDCFAGALVAGLVSGMPTREAVTTAAAAGALAVTKKGPMEGARFLKDVQSFMAQSAAPVM